MTIKLFFSIVLTAVFIENYVLQQFLGICPFLGVSKKLDSAFGMSLAVIFVMLLATAVTFPIQHYILDANNMKYMQTIVFILVIAALVQLVEITLKKYVPALHASLGVYLPLITTNCAVLGVCIDNVDSYMGTSGFGSTFGQALSYSFGAGVGFLMAMVLFAGVRGRIEDNDAPPSFKGMPITLVSAAILSVAFFGFTGVVDNLFGS